MRPAPNLLLGQAHTGLPAAVCLSVQTRNARKRVRTECRGSEEKAGVLRSKEPNLWRRKRHKGQRHQSEERRRRGCRRRRKRRGQRDGRGDFKGGARTAKGEIMRPISSRIYNEWKAVPLAVVVPRGRNITLLAAWAALSIKKIWGWPIIARRPAFGYFGSPSLSPLPQLLYRHRRTTS